MGLQGLISRCGSTRRGLRFRSSAAVESMSKEEVEKSSQWRLQRLFAQIGKACESRGGTLDCQASNELLAEELGPRSNFHDGEARRSCAGPHQPPFWRDSRTAKPEPFSRGEAGVLARAFPTRVRRSQATPFFQRLRCVRSPSVQRLAESRLSTDTSSMRPANFHAASQPRWNSSAGMPRATTALSGTGTCSKHSFFVEMLPIARPHLASRAG